MTTQPPSEVFATFVGNINQETFHRISNSAATFRNNGIKHLHLLFQSSGGIIADGVCMYNYFRSLPMELTLYNCGGVSSIAVIAFLGAKRRKVSAYANFMIHRSYASPVAASAERLQAVAGSLSMDDTRTEAIMRAEMQLPADKWEIHRYADLWLTAEDAVQYKLAHEIGEFQPPQGALLVSL